MKVKYLSIFFFITTYLFAIEMAFEYRANKRGHHAYLFKMTRKILDLGSHQNDVTPYPFRSPVLQINKSAGSNRIWMASASYAEDAKRKIDELFPNIMCKQISLSGVNCEMLNAARASLTIHDNINQLNNRARAWKLDYAILYSMNLDINILSHKHLAPYKMASAKDEKINAKIVGNNDLTISQKIEKFVEEMTIYGHLRRYLGGSILLSTLQHDNIGDEASAEFKETLIHFISTCRKIGATPILTTFATRYDINNYEDMSYDQSLSLMRYNEYLSKKGWVNAVFQFNKIIRETANENNILLIDIEKEISGKQEYFRDFIHFTINGHSVIGQLLADNFINYYNMIGRDTL